MGVNQKSYPPDREMWGIGLCRYCARCQEWWPATTEYFLATCQRRGRRLFRECKACYAERKRATRKRGLTG